MKGFSLTIVLILTLVVMTQQVYAAGEPQVRFLEPAAGNSGPNLSVVVDASDADGKVREVRLYINNIQVRRERAAPYEWGMANPGQNDSALLNLTPGSYQLRAVAKDNQNKTASATRTIAVLGTNSTPTSSARAVQNGETTLNLDDSLQTNQYLASLNGAYRFNLQGDGNLVLRDQATGSALWSSKTNGQNATRLSMQGDGNLVLYTDTGSAVWSSSTNGSGAEKAVMQDDGNFVIYAASNAVVWSTDTAQTIDAGGNGSGGTNTGGTDTGVTDPGVGGTDAGGTGGNTAESTGEFSTPSAALYSLNSSKQLGFPKQIDTGFEGNGHAESWDGRIFVRTRTAGWFASAFRPERISRNSDGSVDFKQGAFGNSIELELKTDEPNMQHNWLAIVPDFSVSGENPYPSNSSGSYQLTGSHRTYKALVYHTTTDKQMGIRKATFIISNANTRNAQLIKADFTNSFSRLRLQSGGDFSCIEPSVTIDGRLVVCQGHPNNDGKIDNLVYSYTTTPGSTTNWTAPKSIANMYFDDRNTNIEGLTFAERYPVAQQAILDSSGNDYNRGELIKGAYPWISRDGTEIFYQASREGISGARRAGTSVVGRWTGWAIRHIDGPINGDRKKTSRLFLSSPGAFTTMWTPYKDIANLAIPYSLQGPVYPIFGSNTSDYSEIGFDDYLDGNYVMYLGMNELLDRAGSYKVTQTNDTSGHFNNATLVGARFPIEFNGQDVMAGRYGQAIHFNSNNYLNVTKNKGWNSLSEGVSVDMWVRKSSGSGRVRLFNMQDGVELNLINGSTLSASIHDTNSNLEQINGSAISNNAWTHVAFTYSQATKKMALYINGREVANKTANNFGSLRTSGLVRVGPDSSNAQLILDEVKVSNVARRAYEVAHNANVRINKAPSNALVNQVPDHLRSLLDNSTGVDRFSLEAANLGEDLFSDTILSKQQTTSCATCHEANSAFADGLDIAKGNEPTDAGTRNTPMLQNRLFSSLQGWSGISATLDTQALTPVAAAHEMNLPITEAVQRLRANSTYSNRFQQVFGEAPNAENFPVALASFEAIQFSPKNRVDEFKEGNKSVLSASERRGLDLFEGKARCSGCHAGANFTDESFRNNGLAMNDDIGRADVTGRNRDHKLFKVPSLRELGLTGPYMHDGSISSLQEVVQAYNAGAVNAPTRDSDMRPLELSNQEVNDVVAFLGALSENGASGGNTGGSTNVSEVSRVNGILVGGAGSEKPGFTLYVFDNDKGSNGSNCNGGCATAWPPVLVEDSGASGIAGLATITRNDGSKQATYNGRPVYYYAQDTNAGDTKGNAVNSAWWLAANDDSSGGGTGGGTGAEEPRSLYPYSFGGLENIGVASSVEMLERLGYAGIAAESSGSTALNRLSQYQALSESKGDGFEVFSAYLSHKFNNSGFSDAEHRAAIDRLSGKEGSLWVWFHDPDNIASEVKLEEFIGGILAYAVSKNVKIVLYPHINTDLPTATDAMRMANKINHPSLGIAVNLSHELMSAKGGELAQTFNQVKSRIMAVTISGAKNNIDTSSIGARERSTIMSLDESEYDLRPFMRLIKSSGYQGPVGFLNFKLQNPEDYLQRTINRWNALALEVGLHKQAANDGGIANKGTITRQVWADVSGTGLDSLTSLASYPNKPSTTNQITSFEAQSNWADNYGTRIVGYLHAPVTGMYTFWIATDDNGELWLSTNDSASNKQRIASITNWAGVRNWTKFASQKSVNIPLQAGQRYYIEALQKEGGGGDNIAVAWQRPGGSLEVIPGEYLSPITDTTPTPTTYTLTVNSGSGDSRYASGAEIPIQADAAPSGKLFDRWVITSGSPGIASLTAATTTLTMPARAATVTATYKNDVSLRNAENPANTINGLDYKYYSGSWNALPNFDALTAVKTGSVSNYSISGKLANDNFGFAFKGYIDVPTDGTYTFYTNSDDGSKLYIGNTAVVNNDGLHGNVQQSGQIGLKAGKHAVSVDFFERTGGEILEVRYQGPGISKKLIPSNALYRVTQSSQLTNVALGKSTSQSSTAAGGVSSRAVDGNTDGVYTKGSITHTNHDSKAWWKVNLGAPQRISKVTVWNRTDCCSNRLTNFHVDALDANGSVIATQNFPGQPGVKTDLNLSANGVYAVRVQLNGANPLSLAEVQVFGAVGTTPVPTMYALAVNSGNGDNSYVTGAQVTISANTAPSGKIFDRWVVNAGNPGIANTSSATTILTMPARAASVTATYKDIPVTTYSLTVNSGSGDNKYVSGTTVTIKADNAPSGQTFDRWLINSGSPAIASVTSETTTLTMPARTATVTASYKALSAGGPAGYTQCANEGGSCTFSERVDVAYGANGKFAYKTNVTGTITFNNASFGDPIPGIQKAGYSKPVVGVSDTTPPVITLLGNAQMTVTQASSFNDPGATANDNEDGNLSSVIAKSGTVNTSITGSYTLSYNVSDAAGNKASTVNRVVTVAAENSPSENLVLPANGSVLQSFTSEYSSNYAAAALTDGITTDAGWASSVDPGEQSFVYAFREGNDATLDEAVIYAGTGEGAYFSKDVQVWSSSDGNNYSLIKSGTLPQGLDSITLNLGGIVAKNVKLVVISGYRADYWELGEFVVNGSIRSGGGTGGVADITQPVIILKGASVISVAQGSTFNEPGYIAMDDRDGNITSSVTVNGSVNTSQVRSFILNYSVSDAAGNRSMPVTRTVSVTLAADTTRPVISLFGNSTMSITQGSNFTDPGANASDDRDGNLNNKIAVSGTVNSAVTGTYTLRYNVQDAAGNNAITVNRSISVTQAADTTPPVIVLQGNETMSITQGSSFNDPGATASDNRDGNITSAITKSGGVNANQVGAYTISYNVRDAAGNNAATVKRTVNVTSAGSSEVNHLGSTADYDQANKINISAPSNAAAGDLLLLFLSRTDDVLPINLNGWTAGASCFKTDNGQRECHEIPQCINRDGDYCLNFEGGNGRDLATVVFYKTLGANENRNYSFDLRGSHASWAILSAVRGANNNDPIRNVTTESNDNNPDSLFPSVNGNAGDLLLMSMAFDDTTQQDDFMAPSGMDLYKWIAGVDEAGYVYGQKLSQTGPTGSKKTSGPGGSNAKDALISMTIRASGNSGGGNGGGSGGGSGGGDSVSGNNTIEQGQQLNVNQYIASENGRYRLYLQGDGNVVLRDQQTGSALWSSKTNGQDGTRLTMQSDGNFVLYTASGAAVWASDTNGTGASRVVINNDGSLAIYSGDNSVWAENGTGDTGGDSGGNTGGGTGGGTSQTGTFEKRISSSLDDVEENSSGSVNATSTDLELVFDNSDQNIGMRFTGINVPKDATVTRAYVQFTADETNSGATSLRINAHDVDDAPAFTTSSGNVSKRATTNASISWQPSAWNTIGAATANERTPDIKNVIQEVLSRSGWNSGNDIAIIITGSGERTAESFNGSSGQAALLHIEYTYIGDSSGGGDTGENTGGGEGTKIAFIGDTGAGGNFQSVLDLIKAEGAELTIVAGDTSYSSSRDDDWDKMVRDTLGASDPVLVVAGNHDYGDSNFGNVRSFGQSRLNRQSAVQCSGDYAEKMTCNYKNVYFVMSAIGSSGSKSSHESFISNSLNSIPDGAWRVCAWHKNQQEMQVGGKSSEVGWTAYETCRQQGAIIASGHEHSYSRTHLLSDMSSQTIASKSSTMTLEEGKTLAFVSGLGGVGIRDQERGGDWWAKIYTSSQGARYGAMFGTFYEDRAEFYFKNINGQIIDQFTVMKGY